MQLTNRIHTEGALSTQLRAHYSQEESAQKQSLARGQVQTIDVQRGMVVRVTSGVLWLTQQDEAHDVILHPGQQWKANRAGRVVVQALGSNANWTLRKVTPPKSTLNWLALLGRI